MSEPANEILHLFTNPVGIKDIRPPSEEEMAFINDLEKRKNIGNFASVNTYVLDTEELADLRAEIDTHLQEFFEAVYTPDNGVGLRITQSWTNYSDGTDRHHRHSHANSAISGVYYPQSENECDQITFHTPLTQYQRLDIVSREENSSTSQGFWVQSKTGRLVLFPSYMEHSVPKLDVRTSTRISLSFNTFYTGTIGRAENLTELTL